MKKFDCIGCELRDTLYCDYCKIEIEKNKINLISLAALWGYILTIIISIFTLIMIWRVIW